MCVGDFNAAMRGQLGGNWCDERRFRHRGDVSGRRRDRHERRHEDGPIFIRAAERGTVVVIAFVFVSAPMGVDRIAVVVGCGVFVGVRVYKRCAQGCDLDRQRERYREGFPHHCPLLVSALPASRFAARRPRRGRRTSIEIKGGLPSSPPQSHARRPHLLARRRSGRARACHLADRRRLGSRAGRAALAHGGPDDDR